ncbi:hypothetical protein BDM02DRAFT_594289 [Thelephora ganbajun]|uniref:Uncharacterized protein n=1 Tax=Thelephora ganbajun TaxID=370292 RepID=A0ACB6Z7N8_THEGA|nr:hypothetical protein BDM02DRAFT_594289 [Thelephora ganbajun]
MIPRLRRTIFSLVGSRVPVCAAGSRHSLEIHATPLECTHDASLHSPTASLLYQSGTAMARNDDTSRFLHEIFPRVYALVRNVSSPPSHRTLQAGVNPELQSRP